MQATLNLYQALKEAIPNFTLCMPQDAAPKTDDEFDTITWLEEYLTEAHLEYVEWKEFFNFDTLLPFANDEIELDWELIFECIVENHDQDSDLSPSEIYLTAINAQIEQHELLLIEVGAYENARLMVIHNDQTLLANLEHALAYYNIPIFTGE